MSLSTADFWRLAVEGRLFTAAEARKLDEKFKQSEGYAAPGSAEQLSSWLVAQRKISNYQAKVLLAGYPGPFIYGPYLIYDRIETGRLAGMFRAVHHHTRHRVCLYFLSGEAIQDPQTIARLTQETAQTHRLTSGQPHLMRCYHLVDEGAFKFIVLEDILGQRLERKLATQGPLPPTEACRIARMAALGLAHLHAQGQAHGELRPANVWLESTGNAKLLMFPLARDPLAPEPGTADKPGPLSPMLDYLAPELADGRAPDARSDLYALGCTLYHMLANRPPFADGDVSAKAARHAQETPPPLDQINKRVSPELAKLVNYLLTKDPDLRYQQAARVAEALAAHLSPDDAQLPAPAVLPTTAPYEAWLSENIRPPQGTAPPIAAPMAVAPTIAPPTTIAPPMAAPITAAPITIAPATAAPVAQGMPFASPPAAPVAPTAAPMFAAAQSPAGPVFAAPAEGAPFAAPPGRNSAASRARRAERRKKRALLATGFLVLVASAVGGGLYLMSAPSEEVASVTEEAADGTEEMGDAPRRLPAGSNATGSNPTGTNATGPPSGNASTAGVEPPPNDVIWGMDEPIWQSPTRGPPIDLTYSAPGAQVLVVLRPAELMQQPETERLIGSCDKEKVASAIGTAGAWLREELTPTVGLPPEKIEQLIVSIMGGDRDPLQYAYTIRATEPIVQADMLAAWGHPTPETQNGHPVFLKEDMAYYLPENGGGRVAVIVPKDFIQEVVSHNGSVFLSPEMETLRRTTDAQRQLTVLTYPRYLATAGKGLFSGAGQGFKAALDWLLTGDSQGLAEPPQAVAFSAHLTDRLFAELRIYHANAGPDATNATQQLYLQLHPLPRTVMQYVLGLEISESSRAILAAFPEMVQASERMLRYGTGEKQVVLRLELPAKAAHNLALGTQLALLEPTRAGVPVSSGGGGSSAQVSQGILDKLKKKTTLSFNRNTLEKSMEMLSEDLGVPITIRGGDLQLEGITKNQSFGLDERDVPAGDILRKILKLSNPDGKLVYIIKIGKSGEEELFITTRAAVAKNKEKLPPELEK